MENPMKTQSAQHGPGKAAKAQAPRRDRYDADRAEHADQHAWLARISMTAERASSTIDDGINTVEASEERCAAYEAQAMR
jgi:hypothetical protein